MEYREEQIMISNLHKDRKGKLWAFDRIHQGIITFNEDFRQFQYVRGVREDGICSLWPNVSSYMANYIMWINSCDRPQILKYDVTRNKFIEAFNPFEKDNSTDSMYDMLMHKGKLILIPRRLSQCAFVFDIGTETYRSMYMFKPTMEEYQEEYTFYSEDDDYVYLTILWNNRIIKISKDSFGKSIESEIVILPSDIKAVCTYFDGVNYYISEKKSPNITVFDRDNNRFLIEAGSSLDNSVEDYYSKITMIDSYLIALPRHGRKILIYDTVEKKVNLQELPLDGEVVNGDYAPSLCKEYYYSKGRNMLTLCPWGVKNFFEVDMKSFCIESFISSITRNSYLVFISELIKEGVRRNGQSSLLLTENKDIGIGEYLVMVEGKMIC